jgi:hypothetical protein
MKTKYTAAFIIPIGACKNLGEDGWEFESSDRLSNEVAGHLIAALGLNFVETYSGIKRYVGENIGMSLFLGTDLSSGERVFRTSHTGWDIPLRIHPHCLSVPLRGVSGAAVEAMHMGYNVHKDPGITLFVRIQGFAAAQKRVRLWNVDLIFSKGAQMSD